MNHPATGLESIDGTAETERSVAVITALAERRDCEPSELPPLYDAIDPDALDAVFSPTHAGSTRRGRLSFVYDGHEITVECGEQTRLHIDGTPVGETQAMIGADPSTDADRSR